MKCVVYIDYTHALLHILALVKMIYKIYIIYALSSTCIHTYITLSRRIYITVIRIYMTVYNAGAATSATLPSFSSHETATHQMTSHGGTMEVERVSSGLYISASHICLSILRSIFFLYTFVLFCSLLCSAPCCLLSVLYTISLYGHLQILYALIYLTHLLITFYSSW